MSACVDELEKLAQERTTEQLLQVDPATLDPNDPATHNVLRQKAEVIQRLQHGPVPKAEKPFQRRLYRQLFGEAAKTIGFIGLGVGAGYGARGLLARNQAARKFLGARKNLATGIAIGTGGAAILATHAMLKERERRLTRAHTILRPRPQRLIQK